MSAFQKLPDIFQGLSALTNNSQFKCMLFKYHKDLKYWPGDNSIRYDGQRLSPLVKFCRVLKEIDSTIHYEAIDQVMIGETPYLLNKAMEYYDGLVLEKLEIEGKIKEIREKFERPLVNSPVLVAALRRQVQCCRAKLAIKDAMPAIRARAQAMQAALQTSD